MPRRLQRWLDMLVPIELPVLARTIAELDQLRNDGDNVSTQKLTDIVMRDPLMTIKVLRYLQQHRSRRLSTDITTIGHALMMLGLQPFFEHFGAQQALETQLAGDSAALRGALDIITRARHAALYARDWAQVRHDLDPDEIMTAGLLHHCAEILLWCSAPRLMREIADRTEADAALRVESAELAVLGFKVLDLNLALATAWELPELLLTLLDDRQTHNPRALIVAYASALVRHSTRGWKHLALLHDYFVVGKLLGLRLHDVERRVLEVGHQAVMDSDYYGVKSRPPKPVLPRALP
jgi:HD-like signal output (HDOD) protein